MSQWLDLLNLGADSSENGFAGKGSGRNGRWKRGRSGKKWSPGSPTQVGCRIRNYQGQGGGEDWGRDRRLVEPGQQQSKWVLVTSAFTEPGQSRTCCWSGCGPTFKGVRQQTHCKVLMRTIAIAGGGGRTSLWIPAMSYRHWDGYLLKWSQEVFWGLPGDCNTVKRKPYLPVLFWP